jgi:molybdopterin synthase sulfur carrier subunit
MFARAREAAGTGNDHFEAATLGDLVTQATERYGAAFADVLAASRIWVNGDEPLAGDETLLREGDEVAVLPPVSGGAR